MMSVQLLFIGTTELLLIAGIALLLFGGKKLPEMMRGLGKGVREFKKGVHEVEVDLGIEDLSVQDKKMEKGTGRAAAISQAAEAKTPEDNGK